MHDAGDSVKILKFVKTISPNLFHTVTYSSAMQQALSGGSMPSERRRCYIPHWVGAKVVFNKGY